MKPCDEQPLSLAIASDRSTLLRSLPCVFPTHVLYRTYLAMIHTNILLT